MEDCLQDIERALGRVGSQRKSFTSNTFDTRATLAAKLIQTRWRRRQVNVIMRKETAKSVATFKLRSKAIRERQVSQREGDAEMFCSKLMQLLFQQYVAWRWWGWGERNRTEGGGGGGGGGE